MPARARSFLVPSVLLATLAPAQSGEMVVAGFSSSSVGRYDATTEATLNEGKKSRLYVNMTRPKTHAWEAKLSDMLFPTDGTPNWGIRPTPVPELQLTRPLARG